MLPSTEDKVLENQNTQIQNKRGKRVDNLKINEKVWAKNFYIDSPKWSEATILEKLGSVTYIVKWSDGKTDKRHIDQIVKRDIIQQCTHNNTESESASNHQPEIRRSARLAEKNNKNLNNRL